jgi:transposase
VTNERSILETALHPRRSPGVASTDQACTERRDEPSRYPVDRGLLRRSLEDLSAPGDQEDSLEALEPGYALGEVLVGAVVQGAIFAEFREDVIRVARGREPGVHLEQIAADLGISESCVNNWVARADREDGIKPAVTGEQSAENRGAAQALAVVGAEERGPASGGRVSVAGEPAGRMMYPLVRELAEDGIPVTVTSRVL